MFRPQASPFALLQPDSGVISSVESTITDVLKGKMSVKDGIRGILDTFTSSIIDTFVKGLTSPFTGENGLITSALRSFGASIFKGLLDTKKEAPSAGGAGGTFASIFGSIMSFFAEGGRVSGAGTSTSDSIPAMLSNGEFVVNAEATGKNLRLLKAINENRLPKFAEGGYVGASLVETPVYIPVEKPPQVGTNQQVINLTITGDISRQTRAEIYQMLPSIATGVNSYNRERNIR